jgi:hypothetical protein
MDMIRKSIEATIDPTSLEDASAEKPYGGFRAIASDESRDRDGENLYQEEWITPLPDHITVDMDHGMSVATTVGSAKPYFEGNELWIDASFSSIERAQEVRSLVKEGHIKTVSVAALVDRSKKSGVPKRELLNVGIVAIPSNRNALIFDAKSFTDEAEVKSVEEAAKDFLLAVKAGTAAGNADGAMIQAIHDAAGHLGAACIVVEVPVDDGDEDPSGVSEGANKSVSFAAAEAEVEETVDEVEGDAVEEAEEAEEAVEKFSTQDILGAILGGKSINVDGVTVSAEQFKDALNHIITNASNEPGEPQGDSPADPPVEKSAAAADVAPAPDSDSAGEAADLTVVEVEKRASRMAMQILAASEALAD